MDFTWSYQNLPIENEDSSDPNHNGPYSIPPLQTHSRYLYARHGELCYVDEFVTVFAMQFHPDELCLMCELNMLHSIYALC